MKPEGAEDFAIFCNQSFLVLGLGASGLAAARVLESAGAKVRAFDDEKAPEEFGLKRFQEEGFDWKGLDALLLSPGIPHHLPRPHRLARLAIEKGVKLVTDVDLLYQARPRYIYVGITGTNGKSTTTALLAQILKACGRDVLAGGNLGPAALALPAPSKSSLYVLELSSYTLERLGQTAFSIGIFLNLTADHLDRHGNMESYFQAKARLLEKSEQRLIATDDAWGKRLAEIYPEALLFSGEQLPKRDKAVGPQGGWLCQRKRNEVKRLFSLDSLTRLQGLHNRQNLAAATSACLLLGLESAAIKDALASFRGLEHRQEWVLENPEIIYINDSKATNAASSLPALKSFRNIYWLLGGRAKEGGLEGLEPYFKEVRAAFCYGECGADFAEFLERLGVESRIFEDLNEAFAAGKKAALASEKKPATLLLSPAAASFDAFTSFEARGEAFKALALEGNGV